VLAPLVAALVIGLVPAVSPAADAPKPPADDGGAAQAASPAETATGEAPAHQVELLNETLLRVMKEANPLGYEGRYELLAPVIDRTFDLDFMGTKAAGRHWNDLSADEQKRWLDAFRRFTIANYAGRFDTGQSFEMLETQDASHDTVLVSTKLINPADDDVQLNYRLRKTDTGWRIIDVYLQGSVSELALRRAEYGSALDREGVDQVIASIEHKIADLSASAGN
jgi:phospholipid transport system substrate-binding protein